MEANVIERKNASGYEKLEGTSGDDIYVINDISRSWTEIEDRNVGEPYYDYDYEGNQELGDSGNNEDYDTLIIKNTTPDKLMIFFDIGLRENDSSYAYNSKIDDGLYILQKSSMTSALTSLLTGGNPRSGGVDVGFFFGDTNNLQLNGKMGTNPGRDYMETIKLVESNGIERVLDVEATVKKIKTNVTKYLSGRGYDTVMEYLEDDSVSYNDKVDFITKCYQSVELVTELAPESINIYTDEEGYQIIDLSNVDSIYGGFDGDGNIVSEEGLIVFKDGNNLVIRYNGELAYDEDPEYEGQGSYEDYKEYVVTNYFRTNGNPKIKVKVNVAYEDGRVEEEFRLLDEFALTNIDNGIIERNQSITGTFLRDEIEGGTGNDTIKGLGGDDYIYGWDGNDTIYGGDGDDHIWGDEGNDKLYGEGGKNRLYFSAGSGHDTIYSGKGEDTIVFEDLESLDDVTFSTSGNNLVLTYGGQRSEWDEEGNFAEIELPKDTITIANYLTNPSASSVKYIEYGYGENAERISLEEFLAQNPIEIDGVEDKKNNLKGTSLNDIITGGILDDTIKAGKGNDIIIGDEGNDKLYGEEGNNVFKFYDGDGQDIIYSGKGNDTIRFAGLYGEDNMQELTFDDLTIDVKGNSLIIKYTENDSIELDNYFKNRGSHSVKTIELKNPETGVDKPEYISISVEELIAKHPHVMTAADAKRNTITGTLLNDIITGSENNETIRGGQGDDTITGGAGDDNLYGDEGNNTFIFKKSDGQDKVYTGKIVKNADGSLANVDTLKFEDVKFEDLKFGVNGNNLVIKYADDGISSVEVVNYLKNPSAHTVDKIVTADKTTTLSEMIAGGEIVIETQGVEGKNNNLRGVAALSNKIVGVNPTEINGRKTGGNDTIIGGNEADELYGMDGNDTIKGGAGDDTIVGGEGDDKLYGEAGKNKFYFSSGAGNDIIYSGTGEDTIYLNDEEFMPEFYLQGNSLVIRHGDYDGDESIYNMPKDSIELSNYFKNKTNSVDKVVLKDGSEYSISELLENSSMGGAYINVVGNQNKANTLRGTTQYVNNLVGGDKNDTIYGGDNDDMIYGGKGNDRFYGYGGYNQFVFMEGDGNDTIYSGSGTDEILFDGITKDDAVLYKSGNNLVIQYTDNDSVTINNYFAKNAVCSVKEISFIDATVSLDELVSTYVNSDGENALEVVKNLNHSRDKEAPGTIVGSKLNDTITGSNFDDVIKGGRGNDTIKAGAGDDTIYGEAGDDKLYGGKGTNTFVFENGNGNDIVYYEGGSDIIDLTKISDLVINPKDGKLTVGKEGNDLVIKHSFDEAEDTCDTISLANYFKNGLKSDIKLRYNDAEGNVIEDDLKNLIAIDIYGSKNITGTFLDDTIYGSDGIDTIHGGAGDDTIVGGFGDDNLYGDEGNNTFVFQQGNGQDKVYTGKIVKNADGSLANVDTLKFEDVKFEDLKFSVNGNNLVIKYADDGISSVEVVNYLKNPSAHTVDKIVTADKTTTLSEMIAGGEIVIETQGVEGKNNNLRGVAALSNKIVGVNPTEINGRKTGGNDTIIGGNEADELYGMDGDDTIKGGAGDDTIVGGEGDDKLYGEAGNNTFIFNLGDGNDSIYYGNGVDTIDLRNTDLVFDPELGFIEAYKDGNDLIVKYNNEKDQIRLVNYLKGTEGNSNIKFLVNKVDDDGFETIDFNNITLVQDYSEETRGKTITGTTFLENDLIGTQAADTIKGGNRNDVIYGSTGNDKLYGEGGHNAICFMEGDGQDTIYMGSGNDVITFITQDKQEGDSESNAETAAELKERLMSTISYKKSGNDLVVKYGTKGDSITIANYFLSENPSVKGIKFAEYDGIEFEPEELDIDFTTYFKENPLEFSSADAVKGAVRGTNLDDIFYGSEGNQSFYGGAGNNTFVFNIGDGDDKVYYQGGTDIIDLSNIEYAVYNPDNGFNVWKEANDDLVLLYNPEDDAERVRLVDYLKSKEGNENIKIRLKKDWNSEETVDIDYRDLVLIQEDYVDESRGRTLTGTTFLKNDIRGTKGNDTIKGGDCNDIIIGNNGNDKLYGLGGTNAICFREGDGKDTIYMGNGTDIITFTNNEGEMGPDETIEELRSRIMETLKYSKSGNDLVISYGSKGDSITVADYFVTENPSVKGITFASAYNIKSDPVLDVDFSEIIIKDGEEKTVKLAPEFTDDSVEYGKEPEITAIKYMGNEGDNVIVANDQDIQSYIDTLGRNPENEFDTLQASNNTVYTNSKDAWIIGGKGDDTYVVSSLNNATTIYDCGGNDTLQIAEKSSNINLFFDVAADGNSDDNSALLIFNKENATIFKNGGMNTDDCYTYTPNNPSFAGVAIFDYFIGEEDDEFATYDVGTIEKIKTSDGKYITNADIAKIAESVQGWLTQNGFESSMEAFQSKTASELSGLYACYQNIQWHTDTTLL